MKIIEKRDKETLYYQFGLFNDIKFVNHLFTTRIGWSNENLDDKISYIFHVPKTNIIKAKQVHGTDIMIVDKGVNDFNKIAKLERDGLITNIPNLVLTTYHADCVPIYFVDIEKKTIGLAHGGWRGTYNNISGKMIDTMIKTYDSKIENILVGIGPSIGPCCYEVGQDLGEQFIEKYDKFKDILQFKDKKFYLDLWRVNYYQVKEKGIIEKNIVQSDFCTSCNVDKLYSYRKEKGTKNRMIAAISIIEK